LTNSRPRWRAEEKWIWRTFDLPSGLRREVMGTRWERCILEVRRMGVPLRVTVAKVSRPEKTRSVNFVGLGGEGNERR
jgi:hypothetical protein